MGLARWQPQGPRLYPHRSADGMCRSVSPTLTVRAGNRNTWPIRVRRGGFPVSETLGHILGIPPVHLVPVFASYPCLPHTRVCLIQSGTHMATDIPALLLRFHRSSSQHPESSEFVVVACRRGSGINRGRGGRFVKSRNLTPGRPSGAFIPLACRPYLRRHIHTPYKPRTGVRG